MIEIIYTACIGAAVSAVWIYAITPIAFLARVDDTKLFRLWFKLGLPLGIMIAIALKILNVINYE